MTDINNITNQIVARQQTPSQSSVYGQKTPTLSDFVGMLLSPQGAPADATTLQNMPDNLKAMAEKIAAMLNGTAAAGSTALPATQNMPGMPLATLNGAETPAMTPPAGLTSDLSAALAEILQSAPAAEGDIDMNMLASMMNNIEPGADGAVPAGAAVAPAAIPADADEMLMLQMMQTRPQAQNAQANALATETAAEAAQTKTPRAPAAPQAEQNQPAAITQPAAQAKPDTALHTLLAAQQSPTGTAMGGFDTSTGFGGQQGQFASSFADGEISFSGLQTGGTTNAAFTQYLNASGQQALPAQTSQMIALQIQRNASAKIDTFTMQLEPADLGRMDIELKFNHDGSMKAHLTVERPETLSMLQKDAAYLERILQQSGLNTDGQSLSFDLRQQSRGDERRDMQTGATPALHGQTGGVESNDNNNNDVTLRGYIGPRGVNIMV